MDLAAASQSGGRQHRFFLDKNPRGFGLMQRDRAFEHYEDLEARYDLRPSYFVEPVGDWGEGRIELVELPSSNETEDNIVAFWVDSEPARPGTPVKRQYRLVARQSGAELHGGGARRSHVPDGPAGSRGEGNGPPWLTPVYS